MNYLTVLYELLSDAKSSVIWPPVKTPLTNQVIPAQAISNDNKTLLETDLGKHTIHTIIYVYSSKNGAR